MASKAYQDAKNSNSLPRLSSVAVKIIHLAGHDRAPARDVSAIVETDPALASCLLKYVNSPLVGVSRRVSCVAQAVAMLGVEVVKNLAIGASLISRGRSIRCTTFDYEAFRSESVARAVIVRRFAHRVNGCSTDEGFTCGLLCQIGRLAFASAFPETYDHVLGLVGPDDARALDEAEREAFRINHNEFAAEMMAEWHLPEVLCDAVRCQDSPEDHSLDPASDLGRLARLLNLAGLLSGILTQSRVYRADLTMAITKAHRLDVNPDAVVNILDTIGDEWCDLGAILDVGTRSVPPFAELYVRAI